MRYEQPEGESCRRENLNQPHNAVMAVLTELSHASVTTGGVKRQG